jgi:hypothetical protein
LTIAGTNSTTGIEMDGFTLTGRFAEGTVGTLNLTGKAYLDMRRGKLEDLKVNVSPGTMMRFLPQQGSSRTLAGTEINLAGELDWLNGEVQAGPSSKTKMTSIHVQSGGVFNLEANGAAFGYTGDPQTVQIDNQLGGRVVLNSAGAATLGAIYTTYGTTELQHGTLYIHGSAEQTGGEFRIFNNSAVTVASTNTLAIRSGNVIGTGTINGNLILGYAPQDNKPLTTPVLSPGGGKVTGTITVNGNLQMFSGEMHIEVSTATDFDKVVVTGYAALGQVADPNNANNTRPGGTVVGNLIKGDPIGGMVQIDFLSRAARVENSAFSSHVGLAQAVDDPLWEYGINATGAWYKTKGQVPGRAAVLSGRAWRDNGALAGVFEQGAEALLANITVRLFDATGTTQLDSTTTDVDGNYEFDGLDPRHVRGAVRPARRRAVRRCQRRRRPHDRQRPRPAHRASHGRALRRPDGPRRRPLRRRGPDRGGRQLQGPQEHFGHRQRAGQRHRRRPRRPRRGAR